MAEIVRLGRRQLATVGPTELSLRAIARDLGMVSSAVYRYVASRDELLTLLIIDAYDDLGDAVDRALAAAAPPPRAQLHALADAVRQWAGSDPAGYGLLYGTPVPGYHAPADRTTTAGTRVALRLAELCEQAHRDGTLTVRTDRLSEPVQADLDTLRRENGWTMPTTTLARALTAWSSLFGAVSFDVFDQYGAGNLPDRAAFFSHQVDLLADLVGLPG